MIEKKVNNEMLFCGEFPTSELFLRCLDYHADMNRRSFIQWFEGANRFGFDGENPKKSILNLLMVYLTSPLSFSFAFAVRSWTLLAHHSFSFAFIGAAISWLISIKNK